MRDQDLADRTDGRHGRPVRDGAHLDEEQDLVGSGIDQPADIVDRVLDRAVGVLLDMVVAGLEIADLDLLLAEIRDQIVLVAGERRQLVLGRKLLDLGRGAVPVEMLDRLDEEALAAQADPPRLIAITRITAGQSAARCSVGRKPT